jgi:hypothetical protein
MPGCVLVGFDGSEIARATVGVAARRLSGRTGWSSLTRSRL